MIVAPCNSFRIIYDYTGLFCEKCVDISLFIPVHVPREHKDRRINIIFEYIKTVLKLMGTAVINIKVQYGKHLISIIHVILVLSIGLKRIV